MTDEVVEVEGEGSGFPRFFRLGTLPIMICVLREGRQYGVGISISNMKWWDPERAKNGALMSAERAISRRLEKIKEEEALDP